MSNFRLIVVFIGTAVLVVSFILAFMLRKKKGLPPYFKFFYWIPVVTLLISIDTIIGRFFPEIIRQVFYILQNTLAILDFFLVSLLFLKLFEQKFSSILIKIVFFSAIIISCYILFTNHFNSKIFQLHSIYHFAAAIFCMYYYYSLLNEEEPLLNLFKTPSFWVVTGFFFCSCVTAPLYAIQGYVSFKYGPKFGNYLLSFANLFIIIKHLLFIKAYSCAAKSNTERKTT